MNILKIIGQVLFILLGIIIFILLYPAILLLFPAIIGAIIIGFITYKLFS